MTRLAPVAKMLVLSPDCAEWFPESGEWKGLRSVDIGPCQLFRSQHCDVTKMILKRYIKRYVKICNRQGECDMIFVDSEKRKGEK